MEKAELKKFKELLLKMKSDIINSGVLNSREDLQVSTDDLADEADLANNVINQQVTFNMRNREFAKLRAIEVALERIEDGTYGHCEECDEAIGKKRLEHQPWADLCITHAEEREREEQRFKRIG
ncbi:TraR/DksA family transcriptional regulator [Halobacteriovorax sp. GB3]|uniref:TraR/DksA family transcriptional regulator n=1 Tax=Halobacteriovorax sp. GB3 TaxID=2719615 RepID=UPI00235ED2DC|nr:TraR/DksA family transcriptional regulator [Halobacteriovorax sp. GB3]MDD0854053.1 TraR/DksA family transcriptional regulator [Halobacteriovorax sp. GB3]